MGEAGLGEGVQELSFRHMKLEDCGRLCFHGFDAPHLLGFTPLYSPLLLHQDWPWDLLELIGCSISLGLGKAWHLLLLPPWKPVAI